MDSLNLNGRTALVLGVANRWSDEDSDDSESATAEIGDPVPPQVVTEDASETLC